MANRDRPQEQGALRTLREVISVDRATVIVASIVVFVALTIWWFHVAQQSPRTDETIKFGAALTAAATGLYGIFKAGYHFRAGIHDQNRRAAEVRSQDQVAAALRFMERWNSGESVSIRNRWRQLMQELRRQPKGEIPAILDGDLVKRATIIDVLSYFEELALAIKLDAVDEKTARLFFRTIVRQAYEESADWITSKRKELPRAFDEFRWLAGRWMGEEESAGPP